MAARLKYGELAPEGMARMRALEHYLNTETGLEPVLLDLVRLLASRMNGQRLPQVYGGPLRLRVENQLGYKMVKWIERIEFIESEKVLGKGEGGKNEDDEYFDLLPNI